MAELFKDDPAFAAEYLNRILQDGEPADLLVAGLGPGARDAGKSERN
jgi:DNA-binding phage protein